MSPAGDPPGWRLDSGQLESNAIVFRRRTGKSSRFERLLDFYLGVPLVFLVGALHRRRTPPQRIASIGLLQTSAIGDTVLITAALADLRRAFPDARLVMVLGPANAELGKLIGAADDIVVLPVRKPWRAVPLLRRLALDVLIDFAPWPRLNALYSALSGARYTIGFETGGQHRHFAYDGRARHRTDRHEIENHGALIALLGVRPSGRPALILAAAGQGGGQTELGAEPYQPDLIVLHPWPGGSAAALKRWPAEGWVALARALAERGFRMVITGGGQDSGPTDALIRAAGLPPDRLSSRAGALSLAGTAALLCRARALVSVDTGTMHLAAALGVPVVALHGPTSPARWGPVGERCAAVASPAPGAGYIQLGFDFPPNPPPCMEAITVEAVLAALDRVLARDGAAPDAARQG